MCRAGSGEAELSASSQSNCRASGFEAAPVPTSNYAFDVHIDTGVAKLTNDADATVQNMLQLAWTVLVAAVHGLIVMIEWCYTIDLIDSSAMSGVARGLRDAQTAFTQPWLAVVLPVASVLALYQGLVRRRVAETVGQALLMLAMMVGGLWVIMNPTGTIGSLGEWANQAGLGALGAVAGGSPSHPQRTLADSMGVVFSSAIAGPWCYMEFGNVYRSGVRPIAEILRDNPLAQDYVRWGARGPGRWVTIFASASPTPHVFIVIAGLRLDTSHAGTDVGPNRDEDGPRWRVLDHIPTWAHWSVRHPPGL